MNKMLYCLKRNSLQCAAVLILVCVVTGCTRSNKEEIPVCNVVKDIFQKEDIKNCSVTLLGRYDDIFVDLESPEVSEAEILAYIDEKLMDSGLSELNDDVSQLYFDCDSAEEYKEKVSRILMNQKKVGLIMSARNQVLEKLIDRSEFEIRYEAVENFALEIISGYEREAYIYGMTLPEYAETVLKVSYDDFFELAYEEGNRLIETYLVIGAVYYDEFGDFEYGTGEDIYYLYQMIENDVYSLFIKADENF